MGDDTLAVFLRFCGRDRLGVHVVFPFDRNGNPRQGLGQHFVDRADGNDREPLQNIVRDLHEVLFIVLRDDDRRNSPTMGREEFLLQSTDRQYPSTKRHFAGHCDIAAHGNTRQSRNNGCAHGNAR